jgi:hypothetical protein
MKHKIVRHFQNWKLQLKHMNKKTGNKGHLRWEKKSRYGVSTMDCVHTSYKGKDTNSLSD